MSTNTRPHHRFGAAAFIAAALITSGCADEAEENPGSPAVPELAALGDVVGSWTCTGQEQPDPGQPALAIHFRKVASWDLGGYWLLSKQDDLATDGEQASMTARGYVGHDAASGGFIATTHLEGGRWLSASTPGWSGNVMSWAVQAHYMGQDFSLIHTQEKRSPSEMHDTVEYVGEGGQKVLLVEFTCRKEA